jgi:hypothetical protein
MELGSIIVAAIASAFGFAIFNVAMDMIRDEAKASTPRLAEWLRQRAVRRLPESFRARLDEEWAALLADTPGPLSKLRHAIGFLLSARSIRSESAKRPEDTDSDKPYRLLGIDVQAGLDEARAAYKIAIKRHIALYPYDPGNEGRLRDITEAYVEIKTKLKKASRRQWLRNPFNKR